MTLRPDIAVIRSRTIHICELTLCHETNLCLSKDYKLRKYQDIHTNLSIPFCNFYNDLNTIEVSVLGFMSDITKSVEQVSSVPLPDSVYAHVIRNVINNTFNIYLNRNNVSTVS